MQDCVCKECVYNTRDSDQNTIVAQSSEQKKSSKTWQRYPKYVIKFQKVIPVASILHAFDVQYLRYTYTVPDC